MEFEDLKKIWDTESQEHLYVIDERSLHQRVIRNNQNIQRMTTIFEWVMPLIMLTLAMAMIIEGIIDKEWYQLPEGGILLIVVIYLYRDRQKRLRYQGSSNQSVKEDLEQALRAINYQLKRQQNFVWWFIAPLVLTTLIHLVYTFDGKPWWVWPLALSSFVFSYWVVDRELQGKVLPQKEDLEALKKMLQEPDQPH